ncbi:MAG TPA: hypothetical protein VG496_13995 [Myxococcales bacterium]|nr:hypothetical protein [Myxococcales bacterium]
MFHVKPAARALLVGVLLGGAAAFAQADAGASSSTSQKKSAGSTAKKGTAAKSTKKDPRTVGLGRNCKKRADCSSKAQVCLRRQDQRGKTLPSGFCALPCASIEQGLTPTHPGYPARNRETTEKILKKPPPSRCPAHFTCRSKGGDLPLDLCMRD